MKNLRKINGFAFPRACGGPGGTIGPTTPKKLYITNSRLSGWEKAGGWGGWEECEGEWVEDAAGGGRCTGGEGGGRGGVPLNSMPIEKPLRSVGVVEWSNGDSFLYDSLT